jgi:hypothetical protein
MAIELHVEIKMLDTEPENPMNQGIILRSKKVTSLQSEQQDMGSIIAISDVVTERVTAEVLQDIKDQLQVIVRQPG